MCSILHVCIYTELEVHDRVSVNIQTHEDAVAISLINMLNMMPSLETGKMKSRRGYCCETWNIKLQDSYHFCSNICFCVCFYGASGQCVREFPVFGIVDGVYLKGIIDELSYNQKGELVLRELKTRKQDSLPGAAQAHGHRFQVCEIFSLLLLCCESHQRQQNYSHPPKKQQGDCKKKLFSKELFTYSSQQICVTNQHSSVIFFFKTCCMT